MSHTLDPRTNMSLRSFIKNAMVTNISLHENHGIDETRTVTDVNIYLLDYADKDETFKVTFKIQDGINEACYILNNMTSDPKSGEFELNWHESLSDDVNLDEFIAKLIECVKPRLAEARREQEIQKIVFVGNTFWLNGTTKFKVLEDDGEGRLTIELLSGSMGQDSDDLLSLSSHGLLDGLYMGMIKEA